MPTTYPELYFPVVVQIVIAIAVAAGLIAASTLLGKRGKSPLKDTPYESGMASGFGARTLSVKFYLVGMIFIPVDIEAVFCFPVVIPRIEAFGLKECLSRGAVLRDSSTCIRRACGVGP
jgi:NADH-quinone oxidoreductase subunit A